MHSSGSDRYAALFGALKERGEAAYIPFVTLGDPGEEESFAILKTLAENGADALELGIPFSDPVADGPTIQSASNRALGAGITPAKCFGILAKFRVAYPTMPVGLLVYANLVINGGMDDFYRAAAASGVDSVLVADAPSTESTPFADSAARHGIAPVFIAPPNANREKLHEIAAMTKGYTYFLGRSGVTGAESEMQAPDAERIRILKEAGAPPLVVGFGISKPAHVTRAVEAGADGAISGSATVAIIASNLRDVARRSVLLAHFTQEMKTATTCGRIPKKPK